jgi:hypothetical protein
MHLGGDPDREGLVKTPARWAKALMFMTKGYGQTCEEVTNGAILAKITTKWWSFEILTFIHYVNVTWCRLQDVFTLDTFPMAR